MKTKEEIPAFYHHVKRARGGKKITHFRFGSIYHFLLICHPGEGNAPPTPPIPPFLFLIITDIILATTEVCFSVPLRPDLRYQVEKV